MYCTSCGTKVKDGARFCPVCGKPLNESEGAEVSSAAGDVAKDHVPAAQPLGASDAAERSSLMSFLMQRRQIGRFAMPTFVAILAAIILTAGVAYALVKVYEAFVLPQTQQQEQPATVEKKPSKKEVAAKNKKAHKAYEGVIDRYKSFYEYCSQQDPTTADYSEWASEAEDGGALPEMFIYDAINVHGFADYYYGFKDLDDDGVDELLLGEAFVNGAQGDNRILGIYRFTDGKATSLIEEADGFDGWGKADYQGFEVQGESQSYSLCQDGLIKFSCSQDANASVVFLRIHDGKVSVEDALMYEYKTVTDRNNGPYLVRSITSGGKPVEETVDGFKIASGRMSELEAKHPVADFDKPGDGGDFWKVLIEANTQGRMRLTS